MTLSLRDRMVMTAVAASAIALGALSLLAGPALERRARQDAERTLLAQARLMARVVEDALSSGTKPEALDPVVDEAARDVDARVTVIAVDGGVLADSALSGSALATLDNHGGRPEVRAALAGQTRTVERHSDTIGTRLLYSAVPVRHAGHVVGVARLSRGMEAIHEQGHALWWSAALALAAALVVTGLLTRLLSASLGRALRQMMEVARGFAQGDLAARIPVAREDELGELARIINHSADELQRRADELAGGRARTEAILAALDDGVLAVDHQGLVVLANARLTEALDLEAPIGRHYLEVVRQQEVELLIESVLGSGARLRSEVTLLRTRRIYAVTAVPFPGSEGAPHGAVLTLNDSTERHRLERIRRDFVANASHELRTPLTSVRGFVEALEDGAIDEPAKARRFLAKIRTHADRMTALVSDLLELSRLESGDRAPEWCEAVPQEVAEEVVASFEDLAARKGLSLSLRDAGAPAVLTDAERLRRILENLVDNAVKYTPEGGHIEVSLVSAEDGGARVEVSDDGPGIAAEHLDRLFERFYRVDKARSRELGGTGLGLSIVRHLAEGMGARVTVASTPGRGSRFTLHLPAQPAGAVPLAAQA